MSNAESSLKSPSLQKAQIVSGESVSVLMVRKIKSGCKEQFWALEEEVEAAIAGFPGFLTVSHLPTTDDETEYMTILQFDSVDSLLGWENSEVRQRLFDRVQDMVEGGIRRKSVTGLEGLFEAPLPSRPPRYKMALVITAVIFTLVITLRPLMNVLLGIFPGILQTLIFVAIQVTLMTYLVMPFMTKRLSRWLHK